MITASRTFLILLTGALLSIASGARPNIVFILADDMNRDSWGAYGSVDCKTPNIDRIAREGIRFKRAYTSVAMCAPFRQELYSGRSPWRTRTLPNHSRSTPDTKSISHYLQPLGYRVALAGKTHINPPQAYPFEYLKVKGAKTTDRNPHFLSTTKTFLGKCKKDKKPFCLFIASNDSHAPFTTGDRTAYDPASLTVPPYWIDTPKLREEMVKYYAEVSNFDTLVGMIRKELEESGLWDSTIFMVCSEQGTQLPFAKWTCYDNGLHTGLVARWAGVTPPGSVAEELISTADVTPTLVAAAGGTLKPGDCDGKSFLDALHGKESPLHDYVYGAFTNCNIIGSRDRIYPTRVIRSKTHTLLYNPNHKNRTSNVTLDAGLSMLDDPSATPESDIVASWVQLTQSKANLKPRVLQLYQRPEYEFYDLKKDPFELTNEIDNPEVQTIVTAMKEQLHAKLKELGDADPIATERALVSNKKK